MPPEDKISKITVYKLKADSIGDIQLQPYTLVKSDIYSTNDQNNEYRLYFYNQSLFTASWYSVFQHLDLDINEDNIPKAISNGFILLVDINHSLYGLTGGISHHHLRKSATIEPRFGIIMAQKLLKLSELKGLIQLDTSGVNYRLDRIFRGTYNPSGEIDNLKRILKNVRGTFSRENPYYEVIGKSIQAGEALTVNGQKTFEDIMRFLLQVDNLWNTGIYSISIPQLDAIDPKYNLELINALKQTLARQLSEYNDNDIDNLFLDNDGIGYLPDRVQQYELIYNHRRCDPVETFEEVFRQVGRILSDIEDIDERTRALGKMSLDVTFDDDNTERTKLSNYICGDIKYDNDIYFINNNLWYRASEEFINKLDNELDNIRFVPPGSIGLISWDTDRHSGSDAETLYNRDNSGFIMLHRKLVYIPEERGGIEFCDLLKNVNGNFVLLHIKHACGAALRDLFAQGFVASKLFSDSEDFRHKVINNQFSNPDENAATILATLEGKHKREITIIYAIFDEKQSHIVRSSSRQTSEMLQGTLTPFAKVDLLDRINSIRIMGYNVAVTRITPYPQEN